MKYFFIFLQEASAYHITMSKNIPTQFYKIAGNDGMKLRSGKRINCLSATTFGKDAFNLMDIFRTCDDIFEEYGEINGNNWYEVFRDHYNPEIAPIIERMAGGRFSTTCTRLFALEHFISKWGKIINGSFSVNYRNAMCKKIKESIKLLREKKHAGHERLCGCSDGYRAYDEQVAWDYYLHSGPGYLLDDEQAIPLWVSTPDVTHDEFEQQFRIEQMSWRHDLGALLERFEAHDRYFKRVPHRENQKTFFALSTKTPSACASLIISFL